jgi:hypothetical protein
MLAVGPVRPSVKRITGGKEAEFGSDRSLPWSAKAKNAWRFIPTPLCVFMVWQLYFYPHGGTSQTTVFVTIFMVDVILLF